MAEKSRGHILPRAVVSAISLPITLYVIYKGFKDYPTQLRAVLRWNRARLEEFLDWMIGRMDLNPNQAAQFDILRDALPGLGYAALGLEVQILVSVALLIILLLLLWWRAAMWIIVVILLFLLAMMGIGSFR